MHKKRKLVFVGVAITLCGFLFQIGLQSVVRHYVKDSFYFQKWSSEALKQTVSIEDLRNEPLETLINIHIQPPGLDVIRAILVYIWPSPDPLIALKHVDYLLYHLWALLYGLIGLMVFLWVSKLTETKYAIIATVVFLLHPACIFYATLLDSTFLSSFLIFLMYYLLWKIKHNHNVPISVLIFTILALFFTRSIFQWPFIFLFTFSLFLIRMPRKKILLFLLITGGVVFLYTGKQYYKFGIFSTSSFTGLNLTRSVGIKITPNDYYYYLNNSNLPKQESVLPSVLTRKYKINGSRNFNHINYLKFNQYLIDQYKMHLSEVDALQLMKSYLQNTKIYFKPSSRYKKHDIVDRIPWRSFYDRIFSFPILNALILFYGILWLVRAVKHRDIIASLGFIMPGLYIFLVTVMFEKGENMRFKFFLEPALFVFLFSQFYLSVQQVYQWVLRRCST